MWMRGRRTRNSVQPLSGTHDWRDFCSRNPDEMQSFLADESNADKVERFGVHYLHYTVRNMSIEVMESLLEKGVDVNSQDGDLISALHIAVANKSDDIHRVHDIIHRLLTVHEANPNLKDAEGKTALDIALERDSDSIVLKLIQQKSLKRYEGLVIDVVAKLSGHESLQFLIEEDPRCLDIKDKCGRNLLHVAVKGNKLQSVAIIPEHKLNLLNEEDEAKLKPIHLASVDTLPLLLSKGADVNTSSPQGSLLCMAARDGNTRLVEELLKFYNIDLELTNTEGETALHLAIRGSHLECCETLLRHSQCDKLIEAYTNNHQTVLHYVARYTVWSNGWVDEMIRFDQFLLFVKDKDEQTTLHVAIQYNNELLVKSIMQHMDQKALQQILLMPNLQRQNLFSSMLERMPALAKEVLNSCMQQKTTGDLQFDLSLLEESEEERCCGRCIIGPLDVIARMDLQYLLSHPVVKLLLLRKWKRAFLSYLLFLCFYFLHMISITVYMLSRPPQNSVNQSCVGDVADPGLYDGWAYVILSLAGLGIIVEVFYIILIIPGHKKQSPESIVHVVLDLFAYLASVAVTIDVTPCDVLTDWQWQLGAVCMFISWLNFLLYLQKVPGVDIHITMVLLICKRFLPYLAVYLLFVLSFALTFSMLLPGQDAFSTVFYSLIRTWVMATGELEYTDIFHGDDRIRYSVVIYAVYVLFLLLMPLVVMNLLTGLAVYDVDKLLQDSSNKRIATQLALALSFEYALPKWLRKILKRMEDTLGKENSQLSNSLTDYLAGSISVRYIVGEGEAILKESKGREHQHNNQDNKLDHILKSLEDLGSQVDDFKNEINQYREELRQPQSSKKRKEKNMFAV